MRIDTNAIEDYQHHAAKPTFRKPASIGMNVLVPLAIFNFRWKIFDS